MSSDKALAQALHLIDVRRYADAKRILTEALHDEFDNDYFFQLLAICEINLNNHTAARNALEQCLALNPENHYGHYLQSRLEFAEEHWSASEAAIRRALDLDAYNPDFHAQLASVQLAAGKTEAAGMTVQNGLALDPNHVDLLRMRAHYHFRNIENEEATASLDEALANDPQNPHLLTTHGDRLLHQNRATDARRAFADALAIDPSIEEARMGLAEAYKVQWWIFRMFYRYSFSRWKLALSWQHVIFYLILIKTMFIWGGVFTLFLLFTWWCDVLFNSCLRLGRRTRYLLTSAKIKQSNFFLLANAVVLCVAAIAANQDAAFWWKATVFCLLIVFLGIAFLEVPLQRQRLTVGIAGGTALAALLIFSPDNLTSFVMLAVFLLVCFGLLFSFRVIGW